MMLHYLTKEPYWIFLFILTAKDEKKAAPAAGAKAEAKKRPADKPASAAGPAPKAAAPKGKTPAPAPKLSSKTPAAAPKIATKGAAAPKTAAPKAAAAKAAPKKAPAGKAQKPAAKKAPAKAAPKVAAKAKVAPKAAPKTAAAKKSAVKVTKAKVATTKALSAQRKVKSFSYRLSVSYDELCVGISPIQNERTHLTLTEPSQLLSRLTKTFILSTNLVFANGLQVIKGINGTRTRKVRTSVQFRRPKTFRPPRNPKYPRLSAPKRSKWVSRSLKSCI